MEAFQLLKQTATTKDEQKTVQKLHIHVTNADSVQIGQFNTLLYVSSSESEKENIDVGKTGGEFELKIINGSNTVLNRFTTNDNTILSIGDNCTVVEIKLNKEIERKLKQTGEFTVTKGDKLVSVLWKNNTWDNDSLTTSELKINFFKDGKRFDTKELELEIFDIMREENNDKLRKLISELIAMFRSKLEHIEVGCLLLVVSSETEQYAQLLAKDYAKLKALLHRTIIPRSVEIEIGFRFKGDKKFKHVFDFESRRRSLLELKVNIKNPKEIESPYLSKKEEPRLSIFSSNIPEKKRLPMKDHLLPFLGRELAAIGDEIEVTSGNATESTETWLSTIKRYSGYNWLTNALSGETSARGSMRKGPAQN